MAGLFDNVYNPDVLSCLANLSSDEVFTPPEVANKMLDMLPQELFSNPDTKFLDPACKSGVFLREIVKRLLVGLENQIPDIQQRINHIMHDMVYGIAITELTSLISRRSLYCSKNASGQFSVARFDNVDGNIRYKLVRHTWENGKCIYCGASQASNDRPDELESHAYEFIHWLKPEEIFSMKFDVVISNPPYQLSDGGHGKSSTPIYQHFVGKAKALNPRYITMIIPSRWFSGGKYLDDFRQDMLSDKHIVKLVDYENFKDVFPGVDLAGGACYFLWDRDVEKQCEVTNFYKDKMIVAERYLDEYDTFVRQNLALNIIHKVEEATSGTGKLSERVSSRKPFGLPTNYQPLDKGVPCWFKQRVGLKFADPNDIDNTKGFLNKWKFLIPKSPIAGQTDFSRPVGFYYDGNTRIAKPGEACTETYIIAGSFDTEEETLAFKSYLFTKIVRFLLLQTVVSQDVTKKNFSFVPDLGHYSGVYTDKELCKQWNISPEEWEYIDSRIGYNNENAYMED